MDRIKRYIQQNKKLSIILLGFVFIVIFYFIGVSLPPEIELREQSSTSWQSAQPIANIQLSCTVAESISVNGIELAQNEINQICGDGYQVNLSDGSNGFTITAENENGLDQLGIVIDFDQSAYEVKLVEENKLAAERVKKKEQAEAEERTRAKAEANKPRVGDSLLGPSFQDIKDKYDRQNNLSSYKGDRYLESLKGKRVVWIAEVSDVDDEFLGDDLYVALHLSTGIIQSDLAFINEPRQEFLKLNIGAKIKVIGTIREINKGIFGLSAYLGSGTTFEPVD